MKKLWVTLLFLVSALYSLFALDGIVTWTWYENDPEVQYYRYQVDGEEEGNWTVVDRSVNEVTIELDVSEIHTLYLQQSRDGETWSDSSWTDSEIYEGEPVTYSDEEPSVETIEVEGADSNVSSTGALTSEGSSLEAQKPRYESHTELDFGFGYMNSIPDSKGPMTVGGFAAYSMTFMRIEGLFELGFKSNGALYMSKSLFTDIGNTSLYSYLNALVLLTTEIGNCDLYAAIGPEFGLTFINNTRAYFGLAAELGLRYHRFDTMSLGFVLSDHYYLAPLSDMINRFDVRVYLSKDIR